MSLTACSPQMAAPTGAGLCWQMSDDTTPEPSFRIIGRDVPNLESCAVQIEGARLLKGRPTSGAYNGYFIFATDEQITSAKTMAGPRIRVFEAEDRQTVQAGLRELIEHQGASTSPES